MGRFTVIRTPAFDLLAGQALNKPATKAFLLFLHHKKEYENPGAKFLLQKMERAFISSAKPVSKSGA